MGDASKVFHPVGSTSVPGTTSRTFHSGLTESLQQIRTVVPAALLTEENSEAHEIGDSSHSISVLGVPAPYPCSPGKYFLMLSFCREHWSPSKHTAYCVPGGLCLSSLGVICLEQTVLTVLLITIHSAHPKYPVNRWVFHTFQGKGRS